MMRSMGPALGDESWLAGGFVACESNVRNTSCRSPLQEGVVSGAQERIF